MQKYFFKAAVTGLGNMYVTGIYRPPNIPLTNFSQFIINTLHYTDKFRTVFADNFNFEVLGNSKRRVTKSTRLISKTSETQQICLPMFRLGMVLLPLD